MSTAKRRAHSASNAERATRARRDKPSPVLGPPAPTRLERFRARHEALWERLAAELEVIGSIIVDAWLARGGCTTCAGTGQVVTWSTLDGDSWTEYGPCPGRVEMRCAMCGEHTGTEHFAFQHKDLPIAAAAVAILTAGACAYPAHEVRTTLQACGAAAGWHPFARNRYGREANIEKPRPERIASEHPGFTTWDLVGLTIAEAMALAAVDAEVQRLSVDRGKTVEVFKGRNVPVGTRGRVFYMGENMYGWRVGLEDAAGQVHWTNRDNVRVPEEVLD